MSSESNDVIRHGIIDKKYDTFKILLTNARSLAPKISSLHTMFEEHELDIALITESWLKESELLNRDIIDLEHGSNLKILYKNRPARLASARKVGGGVAIVYSKASCNFRERKLTRSNFEMVVATGRSSKSSRIICIFCIYIQPRMLAAQLEELREVISDQLVQLKTLHDNPMFFVGGDLNKRDLGPAFRDFNDIVQLNYTPTRGNSCLDIMYSNVDSQESKVWPPLETVDGTRSDHDCVVFSIKEERKKSFSWVRRPVRRLTDKGCRRFEKELAGIDWENLLHESLGPDQMVVRFEEVMEKLTDRIFPVKHIKCRSDEKPWINQQIRNISKAKRRIFKRRGKSDLWHRLANEMENLLETSKSRYVSNVKKGGTHTRAYFNAVKSLSTKEKPAEWSVMDLFPGLSPLEVGDKVTEYFTSISNEFRPITEANTIPAQRRPVSLQEVRKRLASAKIPDSKVRGDVLPALVRKFRSNLAIPMVRIFNNVFRTATWPAAWKEETAVIIPKNSNPASLSECRNISCTAFFSKILEGILLDDLRAEIPPDKLQYGGVKNCSVDHLLVDLIDKIYASVDTGDPVVLLGVDFEKAFNRLDHWECIKQLRKLGASDSSIQLIRSFLSGRKVRAKIMGQLSTPRGLNGGSPQGSILGCLLYCLTTQQLDESLCNEEEVRMAADRYARGNQLNESDDSSMDGSPAGAGFDLLSEEFWPADSPGDSSPERLGAGPDINAGQEPLVAQGPVMMVKYVDDTTVVETVPKASTTKHFTTRTTVEHVPAIRIENFMIGLLDKTNDIGMRVNCHKTQLLCISPANGCDSRAEIVAGGVTISAVKTVKLLGYMIGSSPGAEAQCVYIRERFRARFWSLIHLKRAGFDGMDLFKLYISFVRPILECNSVIFHPMLTRKQCHEIELMQKRVAKLCFGFHRHYADICAAHGIRTLEQRRELAVKKFVLKSLEDKRFAPKWFREREAIETDLRRRRKFAVNKARTDKYLKSPLLYMQRTANTLV